MTFSGAGSSGAFYTTVGCSTTTTTAVISGSSSSQTVYFKNTAAGSLTLQATASGLGSGALSISVQPNSAAALVITGTSPINAGACSSFTIVAEDAYGNTTTAASNITVALSGAGQGAFYSNSGCSTATSSFTINSGSSSQTFYFKDTVAESVTFTASGGSLTWWIS